MCNNIFQGPITNTKFKFDVGDDDTIDMATETYKNLVRDEEERA